MSALVRILYRALLTTLPGPLRRKHGVAMQELYAEALEAAGRRGAPAWAFAAARGLADVAEQSLRARARRPSLSRSPNRSNRPVESTLQDLRLAVRSLRKAPGFTAVATLTLAFGIGANTSIFSLVNAVLLRAPAHVARPDRLVSIYTSDYSGGPPYGASSLPDLRDFRDGSPALADAIAFTPGVVSVVRDDGMNELLVAEFVTGNYFDMLGVAPVIGRGFSAEEADDASGAAVAVLSHGMWMRRYGGDPSVIGGTLRASGQTLTVIGVAPEGYGGALPLVTPDLWIPVSTQALIRGEAFYEQRGDRGWFIQARLADGATTAQAQEQLTALADRLREAYPGQWTDVNEETRRVAVVDDVRIPAMFRGAARGFAGLLMAIVGIVLLIACANVANLVLARATRRGPEVAMKVALGAGRARVIRQLLAESALIGAMGGVGGAAIAIAAMRAALTVRPLTGVSVTLDLGIDGTVFLFAAVLTTLTVLAVGLLPALRASRPDLIGSLKAGGGGGSGRFRWYELRHLLVIAQVAASLVLLVGAGLFLRGVRAAIGVDPGFRIEGLATLTMELEPEGFTAREAGDLFERLRARVARLPGVTATSLTDALPMTLSAGRRRGVSIPGREAAQGEDMEFQFHSIAPGFLGTLGMEMLLGRDFTAADDEDAPLAMIVNETFAERMWPGESPLGKLVRWNGESAAEVVGLVRDAMYRDLRDRDNPAFFIPLAQNPSTRLTLIARTAPDGAETLLGAMRAEVAAIDARLPVTTLQTMEDAIAFTLLPQRIASWLLSIAGGLGLLLAAVGLYGVISFLVSQRTREVGVRMALGAHANDVVGMVVGRALALAGGGVVVGLGLAALVTGFARSLLFGVSPLDPVVFASMGLAALAVAALASWVPARRAARVGPMEALRNE